MRNSRGRLPRTTKAALVSFGNYATLVIPLTDDRDPLRDGIRNPTTQLRTQLGTGLVEGVRAVTGEGDAPAPPGQIRAVAVLMSDGRASDGIPPLEAAQEARRRSVRYTRWACARPPTRAGYAAATGGCWTSRRCAPSPGTGGEYFSSAEAGRLRAIYRELARTIGWEKRPQDVTTIVGAVVMVLLVASVILRFRVAPLH